MAKPNRKISQTFLLVILAIFLIGSISVPVVRADDEVALDDDDTYDMDAPVETEVPAPVETEEEDATEEEEADEKDEAQEETEGVEEDVTEEVQEVEKEEIIESKDVTGTETETNPFRKLSSKLSSIPFVKNLTKQDAKKIAAFSLGAWGAVTGVGWAMQQFGGESD